MADKTIQEIRGLCGGNSLRKKAMVTKWVQGENLEPSWSKLEEALVSTDQEPHATEVRERSRTPTRNPAITATATTTNSDDLKEASDHDNGKGIEKFMLYIQLGSFSKMPTLIVP